MPGVADAERRTRASQKQQGRKRDRETLLNLLAEGRIHEADEHQLEQIKLALELSELMGVKQESGPALDEAKLVEALRVAMADVVANMPRAAGSSADDPSRPKMGHNSMTSISHKDSGLDVQGAENLTQETEGDDDAAEKLKRLRELKGTK